LSSRGYVSRAQVSIRKPEGLALNNVRLRRGVLAVLVTGTLLAPLAAWETSTAANPGGSTAHRTRVDLSHESKGVQRSRASGTSLPAGTRADRGQATKGVTGSRFHQAWEQLKAYIHRLLLKLRGRWGRFRSGQQLAATQRELAQSLRKTHLLVEENATSRESFKRLWPDLVDVQPTALKQCQARNCGSVAVATLDRLTGGSSQAVAMPTTLDTMLFNADLVHSLPMKNAASWIDVLHEVRNDPNPHAKAIMSYEWQNPATGRSGAHWIVVAKRGGWTAPLDPQHNQYAGLLRAIISHVQYARVDNGLPKIDSGWWTSGADAFKEMNAIINGPTFTLGVVRARSSDGRPVTYSLFRGSTMVVVSRWEGKERELTYLPIRNGRAVWKTWHSLHDHQVKRDPYDPE
jgi:hypothetical protein